MEEFDYEDLKNNIKKINTIEDLEELIYNIEDETLQDILEKEVLDLKSEMDDLGGNFNYLKTYKDNLINTIEDYEEDPEMFIENLEEDEEL